MSAEDKDESMVVGGASGDCAVSPNPTIQKQRGTSAGIVVQEVVTTYPSHQSELKDHPGTFHCSR